MAIALFAGARIGMTKVREHFKSKRNDLSQELSGLPVFDRDAELEVIKKNWDISDKDYNRTSKPYQTIVADAEKAATEQTNKKFNSEVYKKEFSAEQNRLRAADYGQPVTFKYKDSSGMVRTVSGTYESSTSTDIFVSGKIISKRRIMKRYRHLFNREMSIKLMADNSIEFKQKFSKRKTAYYETLKNQLILENLKKEGYLEFEGQIMTPKQIAEKLLTQTEKEITIDRAELIRKLRNKYKPFDYFSYDIKFSKANNNDKDNPKPQTD